MALPGALKFGFAVSPLLVTDASQCLRLRLPRRWFSESEFSESGTAWKLDHDTGALSKVYPIQTRSPLAVLNYRTVGFHVLRSVALNTVPVLLEFIQELEASAEEGEEEPPFPIEKFQGPFVWHVIINFCQSTFIQMTRLLLEKLVAAKASARLAWKLTKDASQSAVRKGDLTRLQRLRKVSVTVCRASLLLYVADFIVVNSVEGLSICLSEQPHGPMHPQQQGPVPLLTRAKRFANHPKTVLIRRRMICHACRATICLAAGAAASGTVSAIIPARPWAMSIAATGTEVAVSNLFLMPAFRAWTEGEPLSPGLLGWWLISLGLVVTSVAVPAYQASGSGVGLELSLQ